MRSVTGRHSGASKLDGRDHHQQQQDSDSFVDVLVSDVEDGFSSTTAPTSSTSPTDPVHTKLSTHGPLPSVHTPPPKAGLATHVIIIILYVGLWTSESLVIHAARDLDYEKGSVTLAIEVFKLCVAAAMFFG
eukprot:TRINITY_DN1305_c0_g1_i1.p3 TRINITY_DN1305_c0_g1~~TRINITY_DN1305_c0_g1_i1.p3  ORF type:complete len:132 (-),score=27.75 TRINITY_DN1305_c0_g1_i1:808-1203(-)